MNTKPKRPSLIDNFMVKPTRPAAGEPALTVVSDAPAETVLTPEKARPMPPDFRTSVYFARPVHDKLREIAFTERKSITDLINEGLDHVLATRNYASTEELRGKKKR